MSDQEQEKDILDWLEAAFSMKAPNTVNKRASALLLYATFVYDYGSGKPFPVSSGEVVKYFQLLKESGRYVSRASSLREALRFAHYKVGLKGALSACDDVRAKALSEAMMLQGPEWCPADPLTVLEVRNLPCNNGRRVATGSGSFCCRLHFDDDIRTLQGVRFVPHPKDHL